MAPCQVLTRGLLLWRIKHSSTAAALVQEDVEVPLTYLEDFPKTDLKYGETMISLPRGQSGKIISTKERKTGRVSSIMFEQEDGQQGGCKLVYQTTKKRASGPKCPVTGKRIQGLEEVEPNTVMLIWMLFGNSGRVTLQNLFGNSGRVTLQNLFMFRPGYIRQ